MTRWDFFWSRYLLWSIRICCYFTNFYLFSAFVESLAPRHSRSYPAFHLLVFVYSILCSEGIAWIVRRRYKPRFVSEDDATGKDGAGHLVLTREAYAYRVNAEMVIYEAVGFFALNIPLALFARWLSGNPESDVLLIGALCGVVSAALSFMGVVCMSAREVNLSRSSGLPMLRMMGLICLAPPFLFIRDALARFFSVKLI